MKTLSSLDTITVKIDNQTSFSERKVEPFVLSAPPVTGKRKPGSYPYAFAYPFDISIGSFKEYHPLIHFQKEMLRLAKNRQIATAETFTARTTQKVVAREHQIDESVYLTTLLPAGHSKRIFLQARKLYTKDYLQKLDDLGPGLQTFSFLEYLDFELVIPENFYEYFVDQLVIIKPLQLLYYIECHRQQTKDLTYYEMESFNNKVGYNNRLAHFNPAVSYIDLKKPIVIAPITEDYVNYGCGYTPPDFKDLSEEKQNSVKGKKRLNDLGVQFPVKLDGRPWTQSCNPVMVKKTCHKRIPITETHAYSLLRQDRESEFILTI